MSRIDLKRWAEGIPGGIKWKGAEGQIHCPFHEDNNPSCSINIEKQVFKCHTCEAKGTLRQLASRLGIDYPKAGHNSNIIYHYTDEKGEMVYESIRYYKNGEKKFCFQRPDGHGGYIKDLKGITRLPYRLPALLKAIKEGKSVFICEGEKDVKSLWDLGFTATSNEGGSGKWGANHTKWFPKGTIVYICGDRDEPGQKHVNLVAGNLKTKGCQVKVINLDYPIKEKFGKDITDWVNEGNGKAEFQKLIDTAKDYGTADIQKEKTSVSPAKERILKRKKDLQLITISDILNYEDPQFLIDDLIPRGTISILAGYTGTGKSLLTLSIIKSILEDKSLWGVYAVHPQEKQVLLIDEETPKPWIKDRIKRMFDDYQIGLRTFHFQNIKIDNDIDFEILKELIEEIKPDMVIFDSLIRFHDLEESSSRDMASIVKRFRDLANLGTAVFIIHHHKKGGGKIREQSRGSTDIIGGCDIEMSIEEKDGIITLKSVKTRIRPFLPIQLRIEETETGKLLIEYLGKTISEKEKIKESILEIIEELAPIDRKSLAGHISDRYKQIGKKTLNRYLGELKNDNKVNVQLGEYGKYIYSLNIEGSLL